MKKEHIILLIILVLAALMRLGGLIYHEPFLHDHDEISFIETSLRFGKFNFEPFTFSHAYFLYVILFIEWLLFFAAKKIFDFSMTTGDFINYYLQNPDVFIYIGRLTIFAFGIGVVYLTYKIARNLFGKTTAVISGLVSCFALGLVQLSCSVKADIPALFFLLLSLFFVTLAIKRGLRSYLYGAFFLTGIASATKFHVIFGVFFCAMAAFLYFRQDLWKTLLYGSMCYLGGLALGCPFILLRPLSIFNDTVVRLGKEYIVEKDISFPVIFHLKHHLRNILGIPLEVMSIGGIFYAIYRHSKKDIVLLAFIAPFLAVFFNSIGFAFHLLPVVPLMIILSSRLAVDFTRFLTSRRAYADFILIIVVAILIYPTLLESLKFNIYLNAADTRIAFREWAKENIENNADILLEGVVSDVDISTICFLQPSVTSLREDIERVKERGGTGYLAKKEKDLLEERLKEREVKTYNIYKTDFLKKELITDTHPKYVIISGLNDLDYRELAYYFPPDYSEDRELAKEYISRNYTLEKSFKPTIQMSVFSAIFIDSDYRELRELGLRDMFDIVKGPRLDLYKRKPANTKK